MANGQFSEIDLLISQSLDSNATSSAAELKPISGYAIQHVWSAGTASRSAIVEIIGAIKENGTYSTIDSYSITSAAGDRLVNVELPRYNYVKVRVTSSVTGGGTISSTVSTKIQ